MSDVIKVQELSKAYRIGQKQQASKTFTEAVSLWVKAPLRNFSRLRKLSRFDDASEDILWAVKNVSFNVAEGEVVGIIGRNGAGKSTLLKMLSRITWPTKGRIEIEGRVSSLLEVGTGFHQELTGRENIYLNGTILGMSKKEIDRKFDEIIAFSEVEKFIDTPVKHYSSGMKVRLAFSVAAHLEPEILIIDEVLAVGDLAFQRKCLGKMGQVAKQGRTVLFVSHTIPAVRSLCDRVILLHEGEKIMDGDMNTVIDKYLELNSGAGSSVWRKSPGDEPAGPCDIQEVSAKDRNGNPKEAFNDTESIFIEVRYSLLSRVEGLSLKLRLVSDNGVTVLTTSDAAAMGDEPRDPGEYTITCRIPELFLNRGLYSVVLIAAIAKRKELIPPKEVVKFSIERAHAGRTSTQEKLHGVLNPYSVEWTLKKSEPAAAPLIKNAL